MNIQEMQDQIDRLKAENVRLSAARVSNFIIRPNPLTGTISILGWNGRFPLSLYPRQVRALRDLMPRLLEVAEDQDLNDTADFQREVKREKAKAERDAAKANGVQH